MRVAHISDIHLNTFFKNSNLKQIKFLLRYALEQKFDHLVITGDLVDNADQKDFEILRSLFRKFNLLNSDRLSLVIGNHDIFGGAQTPEEIFTFQEKCRNVDYDRKVEEFSEYFSETFKGCVYRNKEKIFPYAKIIDDVLIAGVNSIARYSKVKNPFASNGVVEPEQLNEVKNIFNDFRNFCKYKLLLIHHQFNKIKISEGSPNSLWQIIEKQTMKLRKKKRLFSLFKQHGVDLVLHGHLHEQREYYRKGIRFLNAGASVKNNLYRKLFINFIDLKSSKIKVSVHSISDFSREKIAEFNVPKLELI